MSAEWDAFFIGLAKYMAEASKDPSTQVGAVIVRPNRTVASVGYNGFARGCCDDSHLYDERATKYARTVHAEANAIVTARESLHGYTLYSWPFQPCSGADGGNNCSGLIIQAGIKRVVSLTSNNPRWNDTFAHGATMFAEAGVELVLYPSTALERA
jgi:dCMP deaminase